MERNKIIDSLCGIAELDQIVGLERDTLIDVIQELCADEAIMVEAKISADYPTKKAKEIALDAAIRNKPSMPYTNNMQQALAGSPVYDIVQEAKKIYEWLIKDEAQVPAQNLTK